MAADSSLDSFQERRIQWQRLDRHWRGSLAEANGKKNSRALGVKTLNELEDTLDTFQTDDIVHGSSKQRRVSEVLMPAFDHLSPFTEAIERASQYKQASELVWAAVMSVIEGASNSGFVQYTVTSLLIDLSNSIPLLDPEKKIIYRLRAVQYALQDIFEDYLGYCTHACAYYSRPQYKPNLTSVFSGSPRSTLELVKHRISRHVTKLQQAIDSELRVQGDEIASLLPAGISDMPRRNDSPQAKSHVEFPVNTVDRARNSAFIGRDDLLAKLADIIDGPQQAGNHRTQTSTSAAAPVVCVLHGLGGVGKTQLALEYYYEQRGNYDACFWLEAEHDWTLTSSFAKISDRLGLLDKKTTDNGGHEVQSQAIEEGRNWLQKTERRWLLIFDNVEAFADLGRYLVTECRCNGTIIVTTQSPNVPAWIENVRVEQVKVLDTETAAMCIFRYLDREPKDEDERQLACQLADHVGCMPLAMATIGGYVKQSQMSLAEFFDNIKRKATLWVKAPQVQETQGYERSLTTVFNKAFEDLTPPTRELLNVLAFLDPDSIPEVIFDSAIDKQLFTNIRAKSDLPECYFELRSRQLIRRDTSSHDSFLSIHRVVQWNILLDLSDDSDLRWECFKQAFNIVQAMLPKTNPLQIPEPESWPPYARHGRQILELRSHCLWPEPPVKLPVSFAQILADMGTYNWFSGKFPEGQKALGTAENILDDAHAKWSDELRTNVYAMLGIITSYEGVSRRQESMNLRKKAYQSRNEGMGKKPESSRTRNEDIMTWQMHSDMAFGFIQEEDFESTAEYMEECFEQYKKWDSDEMAIPFEYAKYYWLISFCHMKEGHAVDAVKGITRCLKLMQKAAGENHPMSQLIKFCHAILLWHTKDPNMRQEALKIHKAVLEFRRQLLGEFSQFTLESYSTCGKLCCDAGEVKLAQQYLGTCLERRKRATWNEEGVTRAQFRYAKVLRILAEEARASQDEKSAQALAEEAEENEKAVARVIERYRKDYKQYMPESEDQEENLDQMVSFWAGRFTGKLKLELPTFHLVDGAGFGQNVSA